MNNTTTWRDKKDYALRAYLRVRGIADGIKDMGPEEAMRWEALRMAAIDVFDHYEREERVSSAIKARGF